MYRAESRFDVTGKRLRDQRWRSCSHDSRFTKNIVRDFPLCDKSFNRSYSGTILTRGREFRDDQWLCFRCRRTGSVIRAV